MGLSEKKIIILLNTTFAYLCSTNKSNGMKEFNFRAE